MSVRESRAFKAAIEDPALGVVSGVHDFDPSPVIMGINRPVYVVSCYSDQSRTLCLTYKRFILLLQNSYVLSFIDNLGLAWLYRCHYQQIDLEPFTLGFAKKFVAEQLYRIRPSTMARVLFLETVFAYEPDWRVPILAKEGDEPLVNASKTLTRLAADFMLHHELGHVAVVDERFAPFVKEKVGDYLNVAEWSGLTSDDMRLFTEEAEADLFGLNCCIASYAPLLRTESLRAYLTFVVRAVAAINVLYSFADDLHRLNVDSTHISEPIDQTLLLWAHREALMLAYIETFEFHEDTVLCAAQDDLHEILPADDLFISLTNGESLTDSVDEDHRRFAYIVDGGFVEGGDFEAVINRVRSPWMLGDPT